MVKLTLRNITRKLSEIFLELGKGRGGYEDQLKAYEKDLDLIVERKNEDGEPHRVFMRASAVIRNMEKSFTMKQMCLEQEADSLINNLQILICIPQSPKETKI